MYGAIQSSTFMDRADIIAREQKIASQRVDGIAEIVIARDVPCMIRQRSVSRVETMLGAQQQSDVEGWFDVAQELRAGYVVRVIIGGRQYRYSVRTVEKYPAPHDFKFQVAQMTLEILDVRP